jgi:hypothetical protein
MKAELKGTALAGKGTRLKSVYAFASSGRCEVVITRRLQKMGEEQLSSKLR